MLLLDRNNDTLKVISDMREKSSGDFLFDMEFIRVNLEKLDRYVEEIVDLLNSIGQDRYTELRAAYELIREKIHSAIPGEDHIPADEGVIPFDRLDSGYAHHVGSKCANLGELMRWVIRG